MYNQQQDRQDRLSSVSSHQQHPFGKEEVVSRQQLFVSFCNNLYLGQWELARACAKRLYQLKDQEGYEGSNSTSSISQVLKAVVRHPYHSVGSESIPSPHILTWLSIQLHDSLQNEGRKNEPLSEAERKQVEFGLLLYTATNDRDVVEDVIKEIYNYFSQVRRSQYTSSSPSSLSIRTSELPALSHQTHTFLKRLLKENPILGHSILEHLKDHKSKALKSSYNQGLQQLYIDCIYNALADLNSCDTSETIAKDAIKQTYNMLSLLDPPPEMTKLPLESLFTDLVHLIQEKPNTLTIHTIYSTLMGRRTAFLISEFCKCQEKLHRQELNSLLGTHSSKLDVMSQDVRITLRLSEMKDRERAWKEMFFQAINGGRHALENIVDTSLIFIREGMFEELKTLMSPDEFHPLKPLVLLLGWNYVNSCAKANKLLEALFAMDEQSSKDPLLEQACNKLAYQVQLVQWCLEKARPLMLASGLDPSIDPKASELFHGLDSHSVLRVLHQSTHLSQLEPTEVFDMLSKQPQLELKQPEALANEVEKEKCVRFASNVEEPLHLSIQQERDNTIYRSFLTIKLFMDALEYSVCQDNGWPYRPMTQAKETAPSSRSTLVNSRGETDQQTDSDIAWGIHVTQKLQAAKDYLSELFPLTYRVEILEDIFSLLFVRHEHFYSEGTGAQSDSGGEEGLVDEDWQNKSCTSLESVENHDHVKSGKLGLEHMPQQQSIKEVTFHQATLDSTGAVIKDGEVQAEVEKVEPLEKISAEKYNLPASGILKQRLSGLHGNGSSEASQYSNSSLSLQGKVGFVASEHFTCDVISVLKECMLDLTSTKFALVGTSASKSNVEQPQQAEEKVAQATRDITKYMKCSVKTSTLAHRISKLMQHINEAWWRFQLVSQSKSSARTLSMSETSTIHESSSDDEWRRVVQGSDGEDGESSEGRKKRKKKRHENRSRSASGKFSSAPMYSALSSPSSEIPSTEGTSSGTEKKRKRRRTRSRRDEKVYWNDNSIIARMLSTKDTLLRMCLRRGSYTQAQQVIKMFEMEGKPEVSEVFFAEFWEKAVQRIQAADERMKSKSTPSSPSKSTTGKLSAIASIASAGVASLTITSIVDDLLTTSSLPVLPQAEKVIEKEPKVQGHIDLLQHLEDNRVPAMVVFDLSIISCKSWQSCRDLLDVAKGRLNVQSSPPEPVSRQRSLAAASGSSSKSEQSPALLGVVPFIHQMHSLITLSTSECNIRQDVLKESYQYSICDALLNASNPLDVTNLCLQINNHLDLKKATSSLSRALKTHPTGFLLPVEPNSRNSASDLPMSSSGNDRLSRAFHDSSPASSPTKSRQTSLVHQSTKHLLQLFDKIATAWYTVYALPQERGKRKEQETANYMLSLYNHVNVLASLLLEAKDWHPGLNRPVHSGNLKAPNPFSILDESPSLLLGRLMFQNQIPPVRLEGVANQLKLDLVHIIIQSCCPCISIQPAQQTLPQLPPPAAVSQNQFKPGPTSQSLQKVLNDTGDWTEPVRHPEVVSRELLSRLMTLMKSQVENYTTSKVCDLTGIILAVSSQEYQDIVSATRELAVVDLNQLTQPEEKLCFFTNVVNLLLVHGAMDHVHTKLTEEEEPMTPGHTRHHSLMPHFDFEAFNLTHPPICSDLVLERLGYLSKICYRIGQLGVISAFDLQYIFLRSELPPPSTFGQILQHRIHDIGEDDPWYEYLPPPETRLLFVISNGCISSPVLQVLKVDDLEEQLSVAMQQYLENNVLVDKEKNVVSIPQYLDWFRKDFTGKSLPIDIQDGHIYGGLLNVVIPHVSQHLGEQLESLVLSCSPGKIELERSMEEPKGDRIETQSVRRLRKAHSFRFTVRIRRYIYDFAYKFKYQSSAEGSSSGHELHRSSSNPELASADHGRLRSDSFPLPPFKMTESTLRYLHSKSRLVASLVGVISVAVDDRTDLFASQKSTDSLSKDDDMPRSGQSVPSIEESIEEELNLSEGVTKDSEMLKLQKHVAGYATVQRYIETYMTTLLKVTETLQEEPDQSCPELATSNATGLTWRNTRACVLADLRSKEVQWLFHLTLNHLMSLCKWSECLEFVDALQMPNEKESQWLQDIPLIRDFILCCAAQGMPSQQDENMSVDSWRYLLRVEDKTLAARVVLGSVPSLSVAASLQLLHHCHAYPSKDARLCNAIKEKLEKMKLYQKITEYAFQYPQSPSFELVQESDEFPMQPTPNPYLDWQYVADESQSNPHRILDIFMLAKDFDLAKHWAEVHGVYASVRQEIQEKYLAHLLKQEQNALKCFQVLEAIKMKTVCLSICESLLASSDISLSSSVFLVQYVLDHFLDAISPEKVDELQSISMGAKALLCLPERARSDYQQLISKPILIVEQLLMNIKVDWAAQVLQCLSHELASTPFAPSSCSVQVFDKLICKYAADAMYIPKVNLNISGDLEASLMHSSTAPSLSSLSMMSTTPKPGLWRRMSITSSSSTASPSLLSSAPTPLSTTPVNMPSGITASTNKSRAESMGESPGALAKASSLPRAARPLRRQSSVGEIRVVTSPPPLQRRASISKLPEVKLPSTPPKREDWVPDTSVTHCMVCKEERFSMFNRRHHCRRCGRVVCWRCSQLKAVIEGYGDTPVRVCSECFNTFIMPRSSQGRGAHPGMEQRIRERLSGSRLSSSRSPGGSLRGSPLLESIPGSPHSDGTLHNTILEFQLTADESYNTIVRQDFYYEAAPSTSLCLSILELHSDPRECGQQILQRCQDLSELLRPIRPGVTNPEVDYNLVISMMKTLLFNAKLKFLKDGDSSSVELCDSYLSHVDVLHVFVSSNCADIPSIQQLQKADSARQVRDRLVKEERLSLAQEVATKSGLDPAAVWTAWGMSCLRAGDYQGAREKFSRILQEPSDRNQMHPPPKLVADILQYLESAGAATLSLTEILTAVPISIRDFIAEPKAQSSASLSAIFDSPALQECLYYIKTYCSYINMVHFYRKHKNFNLARCSTEVFIEGLLVPCMKQGDLGKVQEEMLGLDPTLHAWNAYLTAACRYLNRNGFSHVLYHFQLFMKDFVRAAMTCIKFFQSGVKTYSDLFDRLHHLEKARQHFKAVLDEKQWGGVPRPPMTGISPSTGWGGPSAEANIRLMLTPSDLTKHLNTMKIQIEVTKFLHRMAGKGSGLEGQGAANSASSSSSSSSGSQKPPTLFGNSKEKAEVARKVLLSGNTIQEGFQLAFRIIQDFRLPDTLIYSHVGRHLATIHKYKEIRQLLACIRDTGLANDQSCDEILDACVRVLADDQTKEAEALIKLMKSDTNKINAYILCGKLKSAYLLAVKGERVEDVQRIMRAAKQAGQSQAQMKAICQTWLASQEEKRLREQQAQQLLLQSRQPKH